MFKKGDYIVVLEDDAVFNNWENYVFKQKYDHRRIQPETDIDGFENNHYSYSTFEEENIQWRYAKQEEIIRYNKIKKPYKITDVSKQEDFSYLTKLLKKLNIN